MNFRPNRIYTPDYFLIDLIFDDERIRIQNPFSYIRITCKTQHQTLCKYLLGYAAVTSRLTGRKLKNRGRNLQACERREKQGRKLHAGVADSKSVISRDKRCADASRRDRSKTRLLPQNFVSSTSAIGTELMSTAYRPTHARDIEACNS